MSLSGALVQWRGLSIAGDRGEGHRVTMDTLDGWGDWEAQGDAIPRPLAHGAFDAPSYVPGRLVTIAGLVHGSDRDEVRLLLESELRPSEALEPLTVTIEGRTLTADVRVDRVSMPRTNWGSGMFRWAARFYAPDPLRYGSPVSASTGFPVLAGGLEYDLYTDGAGTDLGYLDYGVASDTGRVVITNTGTAPAPVLFQVEGEVASQGFEIAQVDGPGRLRFAGPNSATSTLVLDGATGNVLVDGDSDRGGLLTWRDWPVIPAATRVAGVLVPGSIEVAFIPLGASSSARLTAVVRPGSW